MDRPTKGNIKWEIRPPTVDRAFPRMDVAGFVGFVSYLPPETYTPVESVEQFHKLFGPDVEKHGWKGLLGQSIRSFFANGGKRAIVVGVPLNGPPLPSQLVDPELAALPFSQLREELVRRMAEGVAVTGLHALFAVDEITLVCMPDAVAPPPPLLAGLHLTLEVGPEPPVEVPFLSPSPPRTFRPLVEKSIPAAVTHPPPRWITVPQERWVSADIPNEIDITWQCEGAPPASHELQLATDVDFSDPLLETRSLIEPSFRVQLGNSPLWIRVRGRWSDGAFGPWSAILLLHTTPQASQQAPSPVPVALHRCLLRFAAARGDVLALLSLPQHFGPQEVDTYLQSFLPPDASQASSDPDPAPGSGIAVPPWTWDEAHLTSFAALFHPWIGHVGRGADLRPLPPEGAVAGLMARQSIADACWLAPANQELAAARGVVSSTPEAHWARNNDPRWNRIAWRRGSTQILTANTLSTHPDLQPLTTRRLLSLLRRLCLREGQVWAFAPAATGTASSLKAAFRRHLDRLFQRGAFAGNTAESSYEVAVGLTGLRDTPRMEVEIRVAPARPLEYLTLRLTQLDPRGQMQVEGQ